MLSGSITALITPFRDGQVDEDALSALVERQIEAGTHGLVPDTGTVLQLCLASRRQGVAAAAPVASLAARACASPPC